VAADDETVGSEADREHGLVHLAADEPVKGARDLDAEPCSEGVHAI
jgi:hypothetical protein